MILNLPLKMVHLTDGLKERIIALHEAGFSCYAISKQLKIDKNTAALWIRRYNENQIIERIPGQGRKRKTDPHIDRVICRAVQANRVITAAAIRNENLLHYI